MPMDMYKSGYTLKIYRILEDDFVDFLNYITIDYYLGKDREKIFSPKLSELLVRIGSQVDIFFRNWDIVQKKNSGTIKKNLNFKNYKQIESEIHISDEKVKILETDEVILPFEDWENTLKWWIAYNKVKHDGFVNKKDGNLLNVIESLAALFILNCIHEGSKIKLYKYGYKKINLKMFNYVAEEDFYFDYDSYPLTTSQLFEFEKNYSPLKISIPKQKP